MTYNPILRKEKMQKILTTRKLPVAEEGTVIILSKDLVDLQKSLADIRNNEVTNAELRWGKYRTSFLIDISSHEVQIKYELSSIDPIYNFIVKLDFDCRVKEAKKIIEKNIVDVNKYLKNYFQADLHKVCQKYNLQEYDTARENIYSKILEISKNIDEFHIERITCNVDIDEKYKKNIEELNAIENEKNKDILNMQLEQEVEKERGGLQALKMRNIQNMLNGDDTALLYYDLINEGDRGKEILQTKHRLAQEKFDKAMNYIKMLVEEGLIDPIDAQKFISNMTHKAFGDGNSSQVHEAGVSYQNEEWKNILSNGSYDEDDD
jgi:hypothetical protein